MKRNFISFHFVSFCFVSFTFHSLAHTRSHTIIRVRAESEKTHNRRAATTTMTTAVAHNTCFAERMCDLLLHTNDTPHTAGMRTSVCESKQYVFFSITSLHLFACMLYRFVLRPSHTIEARHFSAALFSLAHIHTRTCLLLYFTHDSVCTLSLAWRSIVCVKHN